MHSYLIEILLPLFDNDGHALPAELFETVKLELTERFGGLTAYTRAPAEGFWKPGLEHTSLDEIVHYEVMSQDLDVTWWTAYRLSLEAKFLQRKVIVRALETRLL